MESLSEDIIREKLTNLHGWEYESNSIQKVFETKDFASAISFIVRIGIEAEKNDHHPNLYLHDWNKVTVTLSTHSAGGVTEKDFDLAKKKRDYCKWKIKILLTFLQNRMPF